MLLMCRDGLMYPSIHGISTLKDPERYPAVNLTGPHVWDASVLDYTHQSGDGEPHWSNDPDERFASESNFDEFGDYTQREIQTLSILDDSSSMTRFYKYLKLCSHGTKPQCSKNHHSVMMSSWEPQCHHDIIMRTPRITGKPMLSCSRGP